ncbi:MAG: nucleotidyltransferase family protein [Acidobacteria bacterium]|nr:nucleotidyltransferase family protein [Acidobacteriota bacterium]
MSREVALLAAVARAHSGGGTDRLRQAVAGIEAWAPVLRLAAVHGVMPLTASTLLQWAGDVLPPPVAVDLRDRVRDNARRMLGLSAELRRIRDAFDRSGLRVLAFKGPTLAMLAYGNVALRRSRDLDLLVEPGSLPRAHDLVADLGYGIADPLTSLAGADLRQYLRSSHQAEYVNTALAMRIDVQTALAPPFLPSPDFDQLWDRRTLVALPGGAVDAIGPADLLPALCQHGLRHGWERFQWVVDVALLAARSPITTGAERLENGWAASRAVALGLSLAEETTGIDGGRTATRVVADAGVRRLTRIAARALFEDATVRQRAWTNFRLQYGAQEHWRAKARYLRALAETRSNADWAASPSAASSSSLVSALQRTWRLAIDYGGGWWSRGSSRRHT